MQEIQPPPVPSSDDKLWIILSHVSLLLGVGVILPLVVYLVKKDSSAVVAEHAKEALNFHISIYIYAAVCVILVFVIIGFFLLIALSLASLVLAIIACVKASEGTLFRYPMTLRLVK